MSTEIKTKEDLENAFEDCYDRHTAATGGGYEADYTDKWGVWEDFYPHIQEYAAIKAIEFAEFLHPDSDGNHWVMYERAECWINPKTDEAKSSDELYKLFIQQTEKQ